MTSTNKRLLASAVLAAIGVLASLAAIFLIIRGQIFLSFAASCPLWSTAILFFLASIGIHCSSCRRMAFFGFVGCVVIGEIAFIAGFFGPIILTPNANQGPLLGIFITGPIGTLVGTLLGIMTAIIMNKIRRQANPPYSEPAP